MATSDANNLLSAVGCGCVYPWEEPRPLANAAASITEGDAVVAQYYSDEEYHRRCAHC